MVGYLKPDFCNPRLKKIYCKGYKFFVVDVPYCNSYIFVFRPELLSRLAEGSMPIILRAFHGTTNAGDLLSEARKSHTWAPVCPLRRYVNYLGDQF